MADLQDELHTTVEVGELDRPAAWPESESLGATKTAPVTDPGTGPLDRAHAFLAGHPVADGYSGLPWALRQDRRWPISSGCQAAGSSHRIP